MRRSCGAAMVMAISLSACAPLTGGHVPARGQVDGNGQVSVARPPAVERNHVSSSGRIDALILRPRTAIEIIENLEFIFRRNLLLDEGFYSRNGLAETFNFERLDIFNKRERGGVKSGVSIIGPLSRKIFPFVEVAGTNSVVPGASIVGGVSVFGNGSIKASVNFGVRRSDVDFDASISIFGLNFLREDERGRYSHPERVPKPTAVHGNESWIYREEVEGVKRFVRLSFNPAGYLSSIIVEVDSGGGYVAE